MRVGGAAEDDAAGGYAEVPAAVDGVGTRCSEASLGLILFSMARAK